MKDAIYDELCSNHPRPNTQHATKLFPSFSSFLILIFFNVVLQTKPHTKNNNYLFHGSFSFCLCFYFLLLLFSLLLYLARFVVAVVVVVCSYFDLFYLFGSIVPLARREPLSRPVYFLLATV